MIYKKINSKVIISRILDTYNLNAESFVSRVPNWIYNAMRSIKVSDNLIPAVVYSTVRDYKCVIPDNTIELEAVTYNGFRLPRIDYINQSVSSEMDDNYHPTLKYQLDNNGYIITTFRNGNIRFYIKTFPLSFDADSNIFFPLIPDNEELHTALEWYILRQLLYRRYNLPGLSLRDNNPFTNPALAWEKHKLIARNSLVSLDTDDREAISRMLRSLLSNYYRYYESFGNVGELYSNSTKIDITGTLFVYVQSEPSKIWYINHNLNTYPDITIISDGKEVIYANIQYVDYNNAIVTFNEAITGSAYCRR